MLDRTLYNTVLSQTYSPCGRYLLAGNTYGQLAIFDLDRILNPSDRTEITSDYNKPKKVHTIDSESQICSLASTEQFLIIGTTVEITGWNWKTILGSKTIKPEWTIQIPSSKSVIEQRDVNSLWLKDDSRRLHAGCGDNNVYTFDLEDGRLVRTYEGHKDYIHCVHGELPACSHQDATCPGDAPDTTTVMDELTIACCPGQGCLIDALHLDDDCKEAVQISTNAGYLSRAMSMSDIGRWSTPFLHWRSWTGRRSAGRPLARWIDDIRSVEANDAGKIGEQLISASEDGSVKVWDTRSENATCSLEPHARDNLARPDIGKWVGAAALADNWIVCGGGPRLSLWHLRSLEPVTTFDLPDHGIHVASFMEEQVVAGGAAKHLYLANISGEVNVELAVSATTVYSAVARDDPKVFCIAGSSNKIDLCTTYKYTDQTLHWR